MIISFGPFFCPLECIIILYVNERSGSKFILSEASKLEVKNQKFGNHNMKEAEGREA